MLRAGLVCLFRFVSFGAKRDQALQSLRSSGMVVERRDEAAL